MARNALRIGALAILLGSVLWAQDIAGDWQGTYKDGARELRLIVTFVKAGNGGWTATMKIATNQDRGLSEPFDSATLQGSIVRLTVDAVHGAYEGKVSADGASIDGTWTEGKSLPLNFQRATSQTAWKDPSPHNVQFVNVDKDVRLEVLDWGGTGQPLVLLSGLGNTAHVFDQFALKLTATHHVYGVTRRGFGASSVPVSGYSADRLGDDVLAVIETLKIDRPVLVGHSIAGEELSSVGSRHPEKVAGLIYLDAGYDYAFYDSARGDFRIDLAELQKKLTQLEPGNGVKDLKSLIKDLLDTTLPGFERDLRERADELEEMSPAVLAAQSAQQTPARRSIMAGEQKYTKIPVPILAIYASPHDLGSAAPKDPLIRARAETRDEARTHAQATAFERGLPSARVVRIAHANHYVFNSNEADVLREMGVFLNSLRDKRE